MRWIIILVFVLLAAPALAEQFTDTLQQGETKTYTTDGGVYEVKLMYVKNPDFSGNMLSSGKAKFMINGEYTNELSVDTGIKTVYGWIELQDIGLPTSKKDTMTPWATYTFEPAELEQPEYMFPETTEEITEPPNASESKQEVIILEKTEPDPTTPINEPRKHAWMPDWFYNLFYGKKVSLN